MALRQYVPGLATAGVLLACVVLWWWPPLACMSECYVDLEALHGPALGGFELQDTRLNTWILGWVQRSLVTAPTELFDGNVLYPARNTVAGSEHLIGVALQTLPLRIVSSDAVFMHQAALILSSLLIGLTTAALVHWLTGLHWVATGAGIVAIFMPWRGAELSHIQILSAHWIPLIWLLVLRHLAEAPRARESVALAAVLALQLLSSFYIAYFVTLSVALLAAVVVLRTGWRPHALGRLAATCAPGYLLLALSALPYLDREGRGELLASHAPHVPLSDLAFAAPMLRPRFEDLWQRSAALDLSYSIPLAVALLALATLALPRWLRTAPRDVQTERMQLAVPALWLVIAGAFVMSIGPELRVGDVTLPLPGMWAAEFIPGYANLRAAHRWLILIGIGAPVLAAVAVAAAAHSLRRPASSRWRVAGLAALVSALAFSLPLRALPAKPVWEHPRRIERTYAALRELSPGPVLEIPFHTNPLASLRRETAYMVASTIHWQPIANGFTAYQPASYDLIRRVAHQLPDLEALDKLRQLTDVRWIVVHREKLSEDQRKAWDDAIARGEVVRRWSTWHTHIVEIPVTGQTGAWMEALRTPAPRDHSLAGASRAPLELEAPAGQLDALLRAPLRFLNTVPLPGAIELTVRNASERDWPGLDLQSEGLVKLRYAFVDEQDRVLKRGTAFLDADLPAHATTRAQPLLVPPAERGNYRLCLDLVQQRGDALVALPVAPVELDVRVLGRDTANEGWMAHLLRSYAERSEPEMDNTTPCDALELHDR